MGAVLSFVRERERIFLRWLSEVERLLDRLVDPDHAFKAWSEGYSAAEYAAEIAPKRLPPRCCACMDTFWVCENPAKPWDGPAACGCGGAGLPCPACNSGDPPDLPPDFTVTIDDKGPRH